MCWHNSLKPITETAKENKENIQTTKKTKTQKILIKYHIQNTINNIIIVKEKIIKFISGEIIYYY